MEAVGISQVLSDGGILAYMTIDVIAFDADDTLWHNEPLYTVTTENFVDLLAGYHDREWITARLYETEVRNLDYFGYGVKSFALSMIETAIELTEGRVTGADIRRIIDYAKQMLRAPVHLLEHVAETVAALAPAHRLMVITKGDLFDQESKLAQSGLADYFTHVEIVSEKNRAAYESILAQHRIDVGRFLMVGNSLRSDILPVVELGGRAVHIPYRTTWAHETVSEPLDEGSYYALEHIGLLPALVTQIAADE
jgi:putative hydrolase of the HAD superfamily